jgi:putative hydrolase of the HAD superfamily
MDYADASSRTPAVPWADVDTVLLDMDGTLLDLAFDNFFWLEAVPRSFAESRGIGEAAARQDFLARCERVAGSLPWYCLEHWSRELDLDILALKRSHKHRIRYLPMVPEFLRFLRSNRKRRVLVTNAHPDALALKTAVTGLDALVDELVSAHDLAAAKESPEFWSALARHAPFDPARSLLIEDSLPVLRTARAYGVAHLVAIRRPDSGAPARDVGDTPAVDGVADLLPQLDPSSPAGAVF